MRIHSDSQREQYQGIWIICEAQEGRLTPVSLELLGEARRLSAQCECPQEVWAVLFGADLSGLYAPLWEHGADVVLAVDHPALRVFVDEDQAHLLYRLIAAYRPRIVLAGATHRGRALIPRVAVATECGLTADCTSLAIDPASGALLQTRPAFSGNLLATIRSDGFLPQLATVRAGVMKASSATPARCGRLIRESFLDLDALGLKEILAHVREEVSAPQLGTAPVIIAGGRGMKGADGFRRIRRLATLLGGQVGATRAAVDAGWASYAHQIGQTGQTVQPKVYIACGVSGQIQHVVGMQGSGLVIAINRDPDAPLMKLADIAVVGDADEIIECMITQLVDAKACVPEESVSA